MIENVNRELFYEDGYYKQYHIACSKLDGEDAPFTLTNEDLQQENFEICDAISTTESISFANCVSCYIRFVTYKNVTFTGRTLVVFETINNDTQNPIPLGVFTVDTDELSNDGETREVIAYDPMYGLINAEVTGWYNGLNFPITVKNLRDSLFSEFGLEQDNSILINDDISLPKQYTDEDVIYGGDILRSICEINGTFAHISTEGIVKWIDLEVGDVYPNPAYPGTDLNPDSNRYPGDYVEKHVFHMLKEYYVENSVMWDAFVTLPPDGIEIHDAYNNIAYQTNIEAINPYIIVNNSLCFDLSQGQYETLATRLFNKIRYLFYVPYTMTAMGDPCLEVGDRILIHTQEDKNLVSYVLNKRTTGIQVQFSELEAKGTLLFPNNVGDPTTAKLKNLDNRVGKMEKAGTSMLQILSVPSLPSEPKLNVLYLIQGEVEVIE